ncbi:inositol monophosphatase [Alicyclobacillus cycloheptanicus]|uniref:Inositol-1-monophosphatase n=1 Tax=Alicyclobacillus cycloheptanicus TaxID=1457 RepID=A0ABT9XLJ7_9BACL|nr:inositol monophosphatase family protein [Alicyclobacillus cycloheptanicus]MDQ0190894.1 myo-inositol-1(or 4)-monophosphatase [Alicyclobacillus cycloheptanicus]WDM01780.1 inositol monophosphatase [Alicyclobacillus cycloheptanicus]
MEVFDITHREPGADLQVVLATAMQAAAAAGAYFRARIDEQKDVKIKTTLADVVTEVDPACERMIRDIITAAFPNHSILGEETTAPGTEASAAAVAEVADHPSLWIIDPLDGTTNFVAAIPLSVVSIGYAEHGALRVGVVYDPYRDELFYAIAGLGAYVTNAADAKAWGQRVSTGASLSMPGRRLQVTETDALHRSIVATGFPARGEVRARMTEAGWQLSGMVKNLRALGAAALHLAYVAAGRIDAFYECDLNAWDLAGGVCLVLEAGGTVAELGGGPYTLQVRDIVASGHPALTREIQSLVGAGSDERSGEKKR